MSGHGPRFEHEAQSILQSPIETQSNDLQPQIAHHPLPQATVMRAIADPSPETLTPDVIQALQRSHGNQFVQRLIESANHSASLNAPHLSTPVQAKMTVTPAGDQYEQEADAVAGQVMDQVNNPVQRQAEEDDMMLKRDVVQRQAEEDDMMLKRDVIQRNPDGMDVTGDIESSIQRARSGGQALPDTVRAPMENAFGSDFSNVKVHADADSDALNQSLQARAFTTGQDIFFKSDEYNPDSPSGKELLAHELTHVVQQNGVQKKDV